MPIEPILPILPNVYEDMRQRAISPQQTPAVTFGEQLKAAINEVNSLQMDVGKKNMQLALGEIDNMHDVMIAGEKAALAMNLTLDIRNKVIEAYNTIMRMPM